jgi:3-hydroxypropionyl-coenzyme A dehydratase
MGLPETRLGLIPDLGGTTRLTRLIGPARAKELIFTGRIFDAALAAQWGIVNHVVPAEQLESAATALIEELSLAAPLAIGAAKRIIDGVADVERGLSLERWAQAHLFTTADFEQRLNAFAHRASKSLDNLPR